MLVVIGGFVTLQLSVIVSFQAAVGTAQLSIVDKDQGVTTKSARWALLGVLS